MLVKIAQMLKIALRERLQRLNHISSPLFLTFLLVSPSVSLSEKRTDSNGRVYFVHHTTRTTQWEDPRTQGSDPPSVFPFNAYLQRLLHESVVLKKDQFWRSFSLHLQSNECTFFSTEAQYSVDSNE